MRTLGSNGPSVFDLGLGCMGMSDLYGPADDAERIATIHAALDAGDHAARHGRLLRYGAQRAAWQRMTSARMHHGLVRGTSNATSRSWKPFTPSPIPGTRLSLR